jgi:hypothetical protein
MQFKGKGRFKRGLSNIITKSKGPIRIGVSIKLKEKFIVLIFFFFNEINKITFESYLILI